MKKFQFVYIAILGLLVGACNKVLDKTPQDAITDLNFWTSVDNLKLYANNFYTTLYVPNGTVDGISDNTVPNTPNSWLYGDAIVPASGGGWSSGDWENIRNANYFLTHYQQVVDNPTTINQYVGEIKFFRAYEYFNKVKTFGDVPWINIDLNVNDSAYLYEKRTPRQTVIDSVIADLNFAATNLPDPSTAEKGRLHKYAALQMLARVNLYQGTWMKYRNVSGWQIYLTNAAAASSQIMQSGLYSIPKPTALYYFRTGYLVDAKTGTYATMDYPLYYREQFITEDLTTNKECVLPKIYIVNVLAHNLSRNGQSGMGASKDLIEDFLCDDGLPIRLSSRYKGDDSSTVEFQNRDPRLRNIMDNRFLPNYLNGTLPTSDYLSPISSTVPTGYQIYKYKSPIPLQNEANQCTYDMFIFRYAEVLLINAEALAELGTITQADIDNTINQLRARLDEPSLPGGQMGRLTMNPPADPN
ncbi:MAG: RagB/SusD family nutrient uptake outer membrane protein, partial [Pseudopedobacter saltans]